MGLNGSKVQAAEVNSNQEQTQTENAGSEKLDTTENQVDQIDNTIKTVKPSINAWGKVQTESVQTDNVNSKQSTPDDSNQDNRKIETNTLRIEKPVQTLNVQALFATSKVQTNNANTDLATQADPSKLSKDNFRDGTRWTPAGWTALDNSIKIAKESSFVYDTPTTSTLDLSDYYKYFLHNATINATINKDDIKQGNKILLAVANITTGNKQQDQHLHAIVATSYLDSSVTQISFNGRKIGHISSSDINNDELDFWLNVDTTDSFATDPKISFKINTITGYLQSSEISMPGIGNVGPDMTNSSKDAGRTYYVVTNSQIMPIHVVATKGIKPVSLPRNENQYAAPYADNGFGQNYYAGARFNSLSSTQNAVGVQKLQTTLNDLDSSRKGWTVLRTKYYTVDGSQIYYDMGIPVNNDYNYNQMASSRLKDVKLASNLSARDVLAQTEADTITYSYQDDGSCIIGYNITPQTFSAGGEAYTKAIVPNSAVLNLQLQDRKQSVIDSTIEYYRNRNWVPTNADILISVPVKHQKVENNIETVTDLTPDGKNTVSTSTYVVNGSTFDAELYKHAGVQYIDDVTNTVISRDSITGVRDQDFTYKINIPKGYVLANNSNGSNYRFDNNYQNVIYTFNKDQAFNDKNPITIHLTHGRKAVIDSNTIGETVHYVFENGSKALDDYMAKPVASTRIGHKDLVTGETIWDSDWSTEAFNKVAVPKLDGFTPDQTEIDAINVNGESPDIVKTVTYHANNQKITVKYVDDTTKSVLATKELTGKSNTDAHYNTQNIIKVYVDSGYDLVSDNTNGQALKFDSKDAVDQNYEVHLKHHISEVVDPKLLNASFNRAIIEHVPKDKDKWISQHYVITRTGTQDQVTKQYTFTDWSKANVYKDLIDNFEGYTASPKGLKIDQFMIKQNGKWSAKAETFTNNRDIINPINLTEVAEIDYVVNPQEATIVYYDDTADKVLERNVSHGKFDEAIKFNPEVMAIVKKYQDQHYKLTSNEFDNQAYKSDDKNNIFVVHFVHDTKPETREKTVTETIHYVDSNNQKLHDDVVNSKVFTNKGTRDLVTDIVKWDDLWSPANGTFDKVVSPVIDGYTPDKDAIDTQNADPNSKDLEFTVHYKKNPKDAKLIKSETFDVKQKGDTKEQKAEKHSVVKSNEIEKVQPAQSLAVENKVPTGPVNVVYDGEQVVKTNNDESKTTQLTGTMASVLPQTGSSNDNTLTYAGLLLVSLMGLVNGIGTAKKKRN